MKALLADDHDLIRQGVKLLITRYDKKSNILESTNFHDTLKIVQDNYDLDLIVLDLFMPDTSGTQTIRTLRQEAPCTPIMVVSSSDQIEDIKSALALGANGYVPKSSSNDILYSAIELIMSGGIYIPQQALDLTPAVSIEPESVLTGRQIETLQLMAEGKSNKEIADMMHITEHTVKSHITMIFNHLNVKNRTQAVLHAQQAGIILTLQKS